MPRKPSHQPIDWIKLDAVIRTWLRNSARLSNRVLSDSKFRELRLKVIKIVENHVDNGRITTHDHAVAQAQQSLMELWLKEQSKP